MAKLPPGSIGVTRPWQKNAVLPAGLRSPVRCSARAPGSVRPFSLPSGHCRATRRLRRAVPDPNRDDRAGLSIEGSSAVVGQGVRRRQCQHTDVYIHESLPLADARHATGAARAGTERLGMGQAEVRSFWARRPIIVHWGQRGNLINLDIADAIEAAAVAESAR